MADDTTTTMSGAAGAVEAGLWNSDLAPVSAAERTWSIQAYASLWVAMVACVPTYLLAGGLIAAGMNWYQAVLTVFLGNVIVLAPMILVGHMGAKIWRAVSRAVAPGIRHTRRQDTGCCKRSGCLWLVWHQHLGRRFSDLCYFEYRPRRMRLLDHPFPCWVLISLRRFVFWRSGHCICILYVTAQNP